MKNKLARTNKHNKLLLVIKELADEILCAPTVCTAPVAKSFTLMLDEPEILVCDDVKRKIELKDRTNNATLFLFHIFETASI